MNGLVVGEGAGVGRRGSKKDQLCTNAHSFNQLFILFTFSRLANLANLFVVFVASLKVGGGMRLL